MKTREIGGGGVVAAGEGIMEPLLIQWWLRELFHVVVGRNEGTVEGKERLVEGCSEV